MSRRRAIATLLLIACFGSAITVAGGVERSVSSIAATARQAAAGGIAGGDERRLSARAARAADRADLRTLERSRTVRGALRRALLSGAIDLATHDRLRRIWWTAGQARAHLSGRRRAELGAVIDATARLASQRRLTAGRFEPVFLTLRRNRDFWTRAPLPAPAQRFVFGRDPVTFQYYAGRGLQIQPLASFGRANALAQPCLKQTARARCRPRALRRLLDRMLELGSTRGDFLAWEYEFGYGRGAPPWISGMTQATGAQALARGRVVLHDKRYGAAARRALGAFEQPPPVGLAVGAPGGARYTMYSFDPGLRILNGELQAVIGLRDTATLLGNGRAWGLYVRGERAARRAVRGFDTGAWSLYSQNGRESTLSYHRLVGGFLRGLCRRTKVAVYCTTGERFARYVREPPRVQIARVRGARARRASAIRFSLSKVSRVRVLVWGRRGIELRRSLRLARGVHSMSWVPPVRGRHHLQIVATGPGGTRAVVKRTLRALRAPR